MTKLLAMIKSLNIIYFRRKKLKSTNGKNTSYRFLPKIHTENNALSAGPADSVTAGRVASGRRMAELELEDRNITGERVFSAIVSAFLWVMQILWQ